MDSKSNQPFGASLALNRREEIKARLRSKGLNLSDIAKSMQLTPATIYSVVSGRSFSSRVAETIASELGLQVKDIWPERVIKSKKEDSKDVSK